VGGGGGVRKEEAEIKWFGHLAILLAFYKC